METVWDGVERWGSGPTPTVFYSGSLIWSLDSRKRRRVEPRVAGETGWFPERWGRCESD